MSEFGEARQDFDGRYMHNLQRQVAAGVDVASAELLHKQRIQQVRAAGAYIVGDSTYTRLGALRDTATDEAVKAHEELTHIHYGLVGAVVGREFDADGARFEEADLMQEGWSGLSLAVWLFKPELGFKFSTFAYPKIRNAVGRYVDKYSTIGSAPTGIAQLGRRLRKSAPELADFDTFTEATYDKVAQQLGVERNEAQNVVRFLTKFRVVRSLDESFGREAQYFDLEGRPTVRHSTGNIEEQLASNTHGEMEEEVEWSIDTVGATEYALSLLDERQAEVLRLRLGFMGGEPMTLEDVGEIFGVTRERIRQIESRAFNILRANEMFDLLHSEVKLPPLRHTQKELRKSTDSTPEQLAYNQAVQHAFGEYHSSLRKGFRLGVSEKVLELAMAYELPPELNEHNAHLGILPSYRKYIGPLADVRRLEVRTYLDYVVAQLRRQIELSEETHYEEVRLSKGVLSFLKKEVNGPSVGRRAAMRVKPARKED